MHDERMPAPPDPADLPPPVRDAAEAKRGVPYDPPPPLETYDRGDWGRPVLDPTSFIGVRPGRPDDDDHRPDDRPDPTRPAGAPVTEPIARGPWNGWPVPDRRGDGSGGVPEGYHRGLGLELNGLGRMRVTPDDVLWLDQYGEGAGGEVADWLRWRRIALDRERERVTDEAVLLPGLEHQHVRRELVHGLMSGAHIGLDSIEPAPAVALLRALEDYVLEGRAPAGPLPGATPDELDVDGEWCERLAEATGVDFGTVCQVIGAHLARIKERQA